MSKLFPIGLFLLVHISCLFPMQVSAQTPTIKWWFDVNDVAFGNASAADLDGDDTLEIVFSTYRNDHKVYALNAENGSLLWSYDTGGCNDAAPLIYDIDGDGVLEVVVPGSCNPKTFCFDGRDGSVEWVTNMRGSDSPPTIGDTDNDGKLEILHGEFGGYVICFNAEDGSVAWELPVDMNSWIQTAPALLDLDGDNQLDFVVANWNFDSAHTVFAFRADNQTLLWSDTLPDDVMYHGVSHADIDGDGKPELAIGSYDGHLYVYNGEDGSLKFDYSRPFPVYAGMPTTMADLDKDGDLEIIYIDYYTITAVRNDGTKLWDYSIPDYGTSFRGVAAADITGDDSLDVVFGTSKGDVIALRGSNGAFIWKVDLEAHYGDTFNIDHGPIVADFDLDGIMDVFVVGGHAEYPAITNNYGRAYAISTGTPGKGPDWLMFRHDEKRSGCVCPDSIATSVVPSVKAPVSIRISPNPSSGNMTFDISAMPMGKYEIRISDLTGKIIWKSSSSSNDKIVWNGKTLSGNEAAAGIYLLTVTGAGGTVTERLVRE